MKRVINWFEIPATDFARAVKFYENVFAVKLKHEAMGDLVMGTFPYEMPHASGAVCKAPHLQPGANGTLIYLDAGKDVVPLLERVRANGGTVVLDKMLISEEIGHIAVFIDSEGNRIGIHACSKPA